MAYDVVIKDAIVIDGRGRKPFRGTIGIKNRRIRALSDEELDSDHVISCEGQLIAAPGFFDMHSHSDLAMFFPESSDRYRTALESKVTQGITSELVGQDGFSAAPISEEAKTLYTNHWKSLAGYLNPDEWHWNTIEDYLEAIRDTSFLTRIETLVGHSTLRINAMGYENRKAKPSELEEMQEQLTRSIRQGAHGLSLGLSYIPGMHADETELTALATIVAEENGIVVAHVRNESNKVFEAIEEFLNICKAANARSHISHFKIYGTKNIQRGDELATNLLAAMAEGQSISFDMYPYDASIEALAAILPPWAHEGGSEELLERLRDSELCHRMAFDALSGPQGDWDNIIQLSRGGMEGIMVFDAPESHKHIIGKSLADLGREAGYDLVMEDDRLGVFLHLCQLLVDTSLDISVVSFNQLLENVEQFQKLDVVMTIGTNGVFSASPHPRAYGAMTRYLKWSQTQNIALEIAIHNITQHAASILRLERGLLDVGTAADIVVFDPKQISDQATYENPKMQSVGVEHVIIDGKIVL